MQGRGSDGMMTAALSAVFFYIFYDWLRGVGAPSLYVWPVGAFAALFAGITVLRLLWMIDWWWLARRLRRPTGLHGQIAGIDDTDPNEIGLRHTNDDGNGILIGAKDGKPIFWCGNGHVSVRAPTEMGKSASLSINALLSLGKQRNIITTGKGIEVAKVTYRYRSEVLGQKVICIDPWEIGRKAGLPVHRFNPFQHLVELALSRSRDLGDKCRECALVMKPEDRNTGGGENKIFRSVSRDKIAYVLKHQAWWQAETGELVCNPAGLYRVFNGSTEELIALFKKMQLCPDYDGTIAEAGKRFESLFRNSPKSAQSFLTEVQDALSIYAPDTALGKNTEWSDFDPADLKRPGKGMTVHFIVPPGKSTTHGSYVGLALNTLATICMDEGSFTPRVTIIADEFESLSSGELPFVERLLKMGRSVGINLISIVQERAGYKTRYRDKASMFETQQELVLAWGIRSVEDAEYYAKRAGKRSVMTESATVAGGSETPAPPSLGIKEEGIPLFRADEFLQMPDFTAVAFYKQNPPLILDLVHYKMTDRGARYGDPVPGSLPEADFPVRFKF